MAEVNISGITAPEIHAKFCGDTEENDCWKFPITSSALDGPRVKSTTKRAVEKIEFKAIVDWM